jgi:molybdopterin-guanine dinucleotide biosynthesis protein A
MGNDKAAIQINGQSLLDRTVALLTPRCERVLVAIREDQVTDPLRGRFDQLLDPPGDTGPIGAIYQVLDTYPRHGALVLACDMPRLDEATLDGLIQARDPACEATAMRAADGKAHPLCAIWEPGCRALLAIAMAQGELSPRQFLTAGETRLVECDDPGLLRSVNRPEDVADALPPHPNPLPQGEREK